MTKTQKLVHFLKGAILAAGVAVPLIVADPHIQHEVVAHPWLDAYVPLATGLAVLVYKWAKNSRN